MGRPRRSPDPGNLHDVDTVLMAGCCDGYCGKYPEYRLCQPNAAAAAACSAQTVERTAALMFAGTCDVLYGYHHDLGLAGGK